MEQFGYKENDIFRRGPQTRLNACVGPNGGPYDFEDYARGYFLAAKSQLAAICENSAYVDILIYPLSYCYRHGIELAFKHLARELPGLFRENGTISMTHKLNDNWRRVRGYLCKRPEFFDPDDRLISYTDKVLKDFLEFDPGGDVFRFPENRDGELHLQDARIINVEVLGAYLNELGEIFEFWFRRVRAGYAHMEDAGDF